MTRTGSVKAWSPASDDAWAALLLQQVSLSGAAVMVCGVAPEANSKPAWLRE